jgi:hypothetical protein
LLKYVSRSHVLMLSSESFPDIDVAGPAPAEAIAVGLDECPAAVREDPLRLVILVGRVGVVHDLLRLQVDPADIRTVVAVGEEGQLGFVVRPVTLALQRAAER